jgi:hypothetical protein
MKSKSDREKISYICDIENEINTGLIRSTKFNQKRLQELKSEDYIDDSSNYSLRGFSFYNFTVRVNKDGLSVENFFSYICKGEDCLTIYSKNKNLINEFKSQFTV